MSHLLAYEEAKTEKEKALRALDVCSHKNSKSAAWSWAEWAAEHAQNIGVKDAINMLGNDRYPDTKQLYEAIMEVEDENPV